MTTQEGDQISLTPKGKDWFNKTLEQIRKERYKSAGDAYNEA